MNENMSDLSATIKKSKIHLFPTLLASIDSVLEKWQALVAHGDTLDTLLKTEIALREVEEHRKLLFGCDGKINDDGSVYLQEDDKALNLHFFAFHKHAKPDTTGEREWMLSIDSANSDQRS